MIAQRTNRPRPRPAGAGESFQATRRSLIARLKNWDDQDGWREFFETYGRLLHSVALQAGLTESEARDAVQETIISVAKTMPGFKYDPELCSFKTWLHHLALKRIADQFRRRRPAEASIHPAGPSSGAQTAPLERIPDPRSLDLDEVWKAEWQETIFTAAMKRVKEQASVEQLQIFDLYVLKHWPVGRVASTLGVSVAQVYLAKHRVLGLIKKATRKIEREGL